MDLKRREWDKEKREDRKKKKKKTGFNARVVLL